MRLSSRDRLAAPVVVMYWLMLVGGLAVYSGIGAAEASSLTPLWVGVIAGTALGQCLALRDFRSWVAVFTVLVVAVWGASITPRDFDATQLWMAFVPAALCGFWSLSDRCALAAFWFPAVIWMLSILDRTGASAMPDGAGLVLLGGLAVAFLAFLRAREARRVGLWRTVSAEPLAEVKPAAVLAEPPGRQLAGTAWTILVSAITFAVTAFVAPRLWQIESLGGDRAPVAHRGPGHGLPCCEVMYDVPTERSRVKEYFDLGRGHGEEVLPPREGIDCRVCAGMAFGPAITPSYGDPMISGAPSDHWTWPHGDAPAPEYEPGYSSGYSSGGSPGYSYDTPRYSPGAPSSPPSSRGRGGLSTPPSSGYRSRPPAPAPSWKQHKPELPTPPRQHTPEPPAPAAVPPVVQTPPAPVQTPPPVQTLPPVQPAPPAAPPAPAATPNIDPPAAPAPALPPASHAPRAQPELDSSLLRWLVILVAAALLFQLVSLALRPVRRLITLRHLRRPFWDETIDQRVSNSWQLALIGLRDAGWRATSGEAPGELARRVGVGGLDRCATILDRTRHGIGIDAEDLSTMSASADEVYRSARGRIGSFGRLVAWLRWPLT